MALINRIDTFFMIIPFLLQAQPAPIMYENGIDIEAVFLFLPD